MLCCSASDLQRLTGLSRPDVQQLLATTAAACRRRPPVTGQRGTRPATGQRRTCLGRRVLICVVFSALQLQRGECLWLASSLRLSVGCPVLDQLLRGGLLVGGVTELSGESGAGKTQLALQLCLSVQYPAQYGGLDSGQ